VKLYLHIGTEKTGSSHLQSLAAVNRSTLEQHGTYFPRGGRKEQQMLNGQVSSGNAQNLTNAINARNWEKVKSILQEHVAKAKERKCKIVLLSNELMVLALNSTTVWEQFDAVIVSAGFTHTRFLLILRNPVEQALSLYKHRAKGGTAADIEHWVPKHYYYGNGLLIFLKAAMQLQADLVCRKYQSKDGCLEEVFFKNWLGLNIQLKGFDKPVNPSLSFSELLLLKDIYKRHPYLIEEFYNRFIYIPRKQKATEPRLEAYYKAIMQQELSQYHRTWQVCNNCLPESEQLEIPETVQSNTLTTEKVLTFSVVQGEVLSQLLHDALSSSFRWHLRYITLRRNLGKLKRRWIG